MIQKLTKAIKLLTANFTLFSLIVLTVWLPGSILLVYLRLYVFPETTGGDELRIFAQELRVANAIEFAFGPLYVGAILHAASRFKQGLHTTYGQSMAHGARSSFKLLGTRITTGLIVLVGFIALVIPGIFLALRFALIDEVVVLEGVEGAKARNLSVKLTQGRRWNILVTTVCTVIAVSIAMLLLYFILSLVGQNENFVVAVIYECISHISLRLPIIVLFLFYWDAKNQQLSS